MNCRNFEDHIDDMARGALMDAQTRGDALGHAAECAACEARLADERSLTAGLRSLASLTADTSAPERVEAALRAAFRQRHAAPETSAPFVAAVETSTAVAANERTTPAPLSFVSRTRGAQWWLPRWAQGGAVAAASALLVFGLYLFMRQPSPPQTNVASNETPSAAAPAHEPLAGAPLLKQAAPAVAPEVLASAIKDEDDEPKSRPSGRSATRAVQRPAGGARPNVIDAGYNGGGAQTTEIATEFIPLVGGGRLAPGDSGHLMRVEMPRTALASFGIPVSADTAGGRVKADVLIGEDGIARAIRFVR